MDRRLAAHIKSKQREDARAVFKSKYPKYPYFRTQVLRHHPDELLREIALKSNEISDFATMKECRRIPPWGLAAMARDSLIWGSKHRRVPVDENTVQDLLNLFNFFSDDFAVSDGDFLISLVKYHYEQFPYHSSLRHDLARTYLILQEIHVDSDDPKDGGWHNILGALPSQAISSALAIWGITRKNGGWFPAGSLDGEDWKRVGEHMPLYLLEATRDRLTTTPEEAAKDFKDSGAAPHRYSYNPLSKKPLVKLGEEGALVVPQPHLILNSMTIDNLFYTGIKNGRSLGKRVEKYAGKLFEDVVGIDYLVSERKLKKKGNDLSIDWTIVTDKMAILIEVKSGFMDLPGKTGDPIKVLGRNDVYVGGPRKQINRTYNNIISLHSAFMEEIPNHTALDFYGLIVTGGPFYASNADVIRAKITPLPKVPTLVVSLYDLELLSALTADELHFALKTITSDKSLSEMDVAVALGKLNLRKRNPLIDEAWGQITLPTPQNKPGESFIPLCSEPSICPVSDFWSMLSLNDIARVRNTEYEFIYEEYILTKNRK